MDLQKVMIDNVKTKQLGDKHPSCIFLFYVIERDQVNSSVDEVDYDALALLDRRHRRDLCEDILGVGQCFTRDRARGRNGEHYYGISHVNLDLSREYLARIHNAIYSEAFPAGASVARGSFYLTVLRCAYCYLAFYRTDIAAYLYIVHFLLRFVTVLTVILYHNILANATRNLKYCCRYIVYCKT